MRRIFTLLALSALGAPFAGMGCSDSTHEQGIASEQSGPNADPDAGAGDGSDNGRAIEFTTFVRRLIVNETAENNFPTTIDDKTFIDSENPSAFSQAFFAGQ